MKNKKRWIFIGLILICLGLFLFNKTPLETTSEPLRPPVNLQIAAPHSASQTEVLTSSDLQHLEIPNLSEKKLTLTQVALIRAQTKSALRAIFIGQYAFFQEHNRYTTDFKAMGYVPEKQTIFHAKFGFLDAFNNNQTAPDELTERKDSDAFINSEIKYSPNAEGVNLENARGYCRMGCSATTDKFEVISAANLDADPDLDVWSINEKKEIIHLFDDLAP